MLSTNIKVSLLLAGLLSSASCDTAGDKSSAKVVTVEVTGNEFNWHFRYPGRDKQLGTNDDEYSVQNLALPSHAEVVLKLTSKDYLYSFALPDLELREIAVPELQFELRFHTEGERTLTILGDQFCGFSHETLIGEIHIGSQDEKYF